MSLRNLFRPVPCCYDERYSFPIMNDELMPVRLSMIKSTDDLKNFGKFYEQFGKYIEQIMKNDAEGVAVPEQ
eukprot:11181919-Heterocapsa_arctica.AAC.1